MELTRRRHQAPAPVAMDQEAPAPVIIDQVDTQQGNGDNIVTTDDLWDSCKRRILFAAAGGSCGAASVWYEESHILAALSFGCYPHCTINNDFAAITTIFGPPICCCALSAYLCKKALKDMDKKKALLLFTSNL